MAVVDGQEQHFVASSGWDVAGDSAEYRAFLEGVPAGAAHRAGGHRLRQKSMCTTSPSRRPSIVRAAKAQAEDLLEGCQVIDALSSLEFYRAGPCAPAVPPTTTSSRSSTRRCPGCGCTVAVPRQPCAQPFSWQERRNRIFVGVLMYLLQHQGLPALGVQFYNSKFSLHPVDPYRVTPPTIIPLGETRSLYIPARTARRFRRCARRCRTTRCWTCGRCGCLEQLPGARSWRS